MRKLKHLPLDQWPQADHAAFAAAYAPRDIFDDSRGPGAHLMPGTRQPIETACRRWLRFLKDHYPDDLLKPPADRITRERVRAFIQHLGGEVKPATVAIYCTHLYYAARLIAPERDWRWLQALKARLNAMAGRGDRFLHLVPPLQTLDLSFKLMDEALELPITSRKGREISYRDGLLLALLSLWPIRRRSIAALTVSRHLEFTNDSINLLLHAADIKSKRAESFRVPDQLVPYLKRYLHEIRPRLLGRHDHDGLWVSYRGTRLVAGRIYDIVRRIVMQRFGKAMGLHDFRRAAATHLATEAPEKMGLIPGVLQHASPEVGEQHYNLARSVQASQRFSAHRAQTEDRLRPLRRREG